MPTGRPAGSSTRRRDEIVAAAAEVIAERGIKGATVRDIGQAAGILSGSLYHHFASKEQLVLELLLPDVTQAYDRARAIHAAAAGPTEALVALIRASIDATAAHPVRSVILRNEARTFGDVEALAPIAEVRARTLALWSDVVHDGMRRGEFRSDVDVDVAVRAMFDGMLGAARWFRGPRPRCPAAVADALVALCVGGLAAPAGNRSTKH